MLRLVTLPTPQGVIAGGTFQAKVPQGPTYANVSLTLTNITLAQLTDLKVIINGRTVQEFASGTALDKINQWYNRPAFADGILTLHFRRPEMEEAEDGQVFDLGTADPAPGTGGVKVETIVIQGKIDAACVNPAIAASASVSNIVKPLVLLTKVLRLPVSPAGAGAFEFDQLPVRQAGAILMAVHFNKSDVDNVTMKANVAGVNTELVEDDMAKTLLHRMQTMGPRTRVPQTATFTHVDFLAGSGQLVDGLPMDAVTDLRARLTLGAGGNFDAYAEYADDLIGV